MARSNKKCHWSTKLCQKQLFVFYSLLRTRSRSSRSQMFLKIDVLKNFAIFTGKRLCYEFLFNELAGLQSSGVIKKKPQHRCLPVNIAEFLRKDLERLRWLPLQVY